MHMTVRSTLPGVLVEVEVGLGLLEDRLQTIPLEQQAWEFQARLLALQPQEHWVVLEEKMELGMEPMEAQIMVTEGEAQGTEFLRAVLEDQEL
jgi:hypothetical protein